MLQGIEDRMDLIQELQTVHALQREEQELQEADRDFVLSLKEQRDNARHQVRLTWTQNSALICGITLSLLWTDFRGRDTSGWSDGCRTLPSVGHNVQRADTSPGGA